MSRHPLGAGRDRAERYLILTIAAFAVTVAGVRWYLDLAGYPTIGSGELHVAHVLWGGLALFIAALLPLLYMGRRALLISALLAGVGAGLFIDEVGKFLTTSNNYFFAPAAPIIYGGILLLVLLWLLVRRRGTSTYSATHAAIEALSAGVDGQLTGADRARVIEELRHAQDAGEDTTRPDTLTQALVATLRLPAMDERLTGEGWVARGDARRMLERILSTRVERWLIIIGLVWAALVAAGSAIGMLVVSTGSGEWLESIVAQAGHLEIPTRPIWVLLMLGINIVVGISSAVAVVLLWRGRDDAAMNVGLLASLTSLIAGGLIGFYAVQLMALGSTLHSLLLLGLIVDQRIRLEQTAADVDDEAE